MSLSALPNQLRSSRRKAGYRAWAASHPRLVWMVIFATGALVGACSDGEDEVQTSRSTTSVSLSTSFTEASPQSLTTAKEASESHRDALRGRGESLAQPQCRATSTGSNYCARYRLTGAIAEEGTQSILSSRSCAVRAAGHRPLPDSSPDFLVLETKFEDQSRLSVVVGIFRDDFRGPDTYRTDDLDLNVILTRPDGSGAHWDEEGAEVEFAIDSTANGRFSALRLAGDAGELSIQVTFACNG